MQGDSPQKGENPCVFPSSVVRVVCLACDRPYAKPADAHTILANPGCPECGYLGWIPVSEADAFARSGADQQLRSIDRTG
jgi:hypothetical protein